MKEDKGYGSKRSVFPIEKPRKLPFAPLRVVMLPKKKKFGQSGAVKKVFSENPAVNGWFNKMPPEQ